MIPRPVRFSSTYRFLAFFSYTYVYIFGHPWPGIRQKLQRVVWISLNDGLT